MHAQDRTNRRPGTLTILSAIFMPVTLLAGIWGMNFENMPASYVPIHLVAFRVLGVGVDTGMSDQIPGLFHDVLLLLDALSIPMA